MTVLSVTGVDGRLARLMVNRMPPISMINASKARTTPSVTIAPMTPATALLIPPEEESEFAEDVAVLDELDIVAQEDPALPHC